MQIAVGQTIRVGMCVHGTHVYYIGRFISIDILLIESEKTRINVCMCVCDVCVCYDSWSQAHVIKTGLLLNSRCG